MVSHPLPSRFMMSRPGMEEFLKELLNFQHFRQFINGRIDKLKSQSVERDLFDNEVLMYEEGEEEVERGLWKEEGRSKENREKGNNKKAMQLW